MSRKNSLYLFGFVYSTGIILFLFTHNYLLEAGEDVLVSTLLADILFTAYVFIFSIIINNSSIYDPYWSVVPPILFIVWIMELSSFGLVVNVALFGVFVWAIRLTRNWWIDFTGFSHEDFRYVSFRQQFKKLYWVVSFLGIHLFPTIIVFVSMYPLYLLIANPIDAPIYVFIGVMIMVLAAIIQLISDGQRRAFKKEHPGQSIKHGLWAYSRHPNYFGEVLFWFGVFVSSIAGGFNWTALLGFIGMLLLFNLYSVPAMEKKLLGNKPDYQEVIDEVPRFFFRKARNS